MDEPQRRIELLEEWVQYFLVQQLVQEGKVLAVTEELCRALETAGMDSEPFRKRLRALELKTTRELLAEFGRNCDGRSPPRFQVPE